MIKLYCPVVHDHQKTFEQILPGIYPQKQALAIALKEKASNPYVGSISLKLVMLTVAEIAKRLNESNGIFI